MYQGHTCTCVCVRMRIYSHRPFLLSYFSPVSALEVPPWREMYYPSQGRSPHRCTVAAPHLCLRLATPSLQWERRGIVVCARSRA